MGCLQTESTNQVTCNMIPKELVQTGGWDTGPQQERTGECQRAVLTEWECSHREWSTREDKLRTSIAITANLEGQNTRFGYYFVLFCFMKYHQMFANKKIM